MCPICITAIASTGLPGMIIAFIGHFFFMKGITSDEGKFNDFYNPFL